MTFSSCETVNHSHRAVCLQSPFSEADERDNIMFPLFPHSFSFFFFLLTLRPRPGWGHEAFQRFNFGSVPDWR